MNQRTQDDCAICTTAMVLAYSYERVVEDRWQRYGEFDDKSAWWEWYFNDEGRWVAYLPLHKRAVVQVHGSLTTGILRLEHPRLRKAHVAVLDERGVVDPADGLPEHVPFDSWAAARMSQGFVVDNEFLAVGLPRVSVQIVDKREDAVALIPELRNFPHAVHSMGVAAEGLGVAYILRSMSDEILGWGHERMRGSMAELSWETHPDHRGHGYMREAARQFVGAVLKRPDVTGAYAFIPEGNTPSESVAESCGMILTSATGELGRMWERAANPPSA